MLNIQVTRGNLCCLDSLSSRRSWGVRRPGGDLPVDLDLNLDLDLDIDLSRSLPVPVPLPCEERGDGGKTCKLNVIGCEQNRSLSRCLAA